MPDCLLSLEDIDPSKTLLSGTVLSAACHFLPLYES